MARSISVTSDPDRWHLRCLRGVLTALIAVSVVLTLFNCGCCYCDDGDEGVLTIAATQTGGSPGKHDPLSIAPHCCHCLAHATIIAPQIDAVAVQYVANPYCLAAAPLPEAADLASPFEPPRA